MGWQIFWNRNWVVELSIVNNNNIYIYNISNQLIGQDIKCVYRMLYCPNAIIRQCISNAYYNAGSLIGYKLAYNIYN